MANDLKHTEATFSPSPDASITFLWCVIQMFDVVTNSTQVMPTHYALIFFFGENPALGLVQYGINFLL